MSGWHIKSTNGTEDLGPFSGSNLIELARTKRIKGSTLIRHEEHTKNTFVRADSIRQLAAALSPSAPVKAEPKQELIPAETHPEDAIIEGGKRAVAAAASGLRSTFQTMKTLIPKPAIEGVPIEHPEPAHEDPLGNFVADGQDPATVLKILDRVRSLCITGEVPLYMAVQQRPVANFSPDAVVVTNGRLIIMRQKILGRMSFEDHLWRDVADAHVEDHIMSSSLTFRSVGGHRHKVEWLPKEQAKKVYRIAQEQEQIAIKARRDYYLEEQRAGAAQTVVNTTLNTAVAAPISAPAADPNDPVARLQKLKQMLDAGLIDQSEFDAKKRQLLADL